MFSLGGVACGAESDGICDEIRRFVLDRFLTASPIGAAGCAGRLDGADGGFAGGVTVPVPLPFDPTEATMDEFAAAPEPADELALAPAPAPAVSTRVAPAAAPNALSPSDPTATAPPATNAPLEIRSPLESAGDPPNTAANSFGICQQSIMKMIEAPIISRADIAGLASDAILCASVIQSTERLMPVPISR